MIHIDSDAFIAFLRQNENWLMIRTLEYAKRQDYTKYTSTLLEAWRISIVGLTDSLEMLMGISTEIPELTPDEQYDVDPACAFGIKEARLHRSRGVNLSMFFTLFKYYRQSYVELIEEKLERSPQREHILTYVNRFFDRVESAYIIEWAGRSSEEQIHELAEKNREQANEKNRYLTIFDSMEAASMVISPEGIIENYNLKAGKLFFEDEDIGRYYYTQSGRYHLSEHFPRLQSYLDEGHKGSVLWEDDNKVYSVTGKDLHDISGKSEGWILLFSDVTEIKASEQFFRQLYEDAPIAYQSLDEDGDLLSVNSRWLEELGYEEKEVLGIHFSEFLVPAHRLTFTTGFPKFKAAGGYSGVEFTMLRKDGEKVYVTLNGTVVTDDAGNFLHTHCIFTDITAQKRDQERLLYEEQYLSAIMEAAPNIMITTDGEEIDRVNQNMLAMMDYESLAAFKRQHQCICDLFEPREGYLQKQMGDVNWTEFVMADPETVHKAKMIKDGKEYTFVVSVRNLLLDDSKRYIVTLTDVTEMEQIRERYEYAMVGANDGIWDWDIPANTIYFSPRWKSMLGLDEDSIGNTFAEFNALVHPDDMPQVMEKVQAHFDSGVQYVATIRMQHTDGSWKWILTRGKVVEWGEDGAPLRMVGTHTDITELKAKEAKIERLRVLLKNILDSVDNLIFVKDTAFNYIECNPAFEAFVGRSRDEIIGHDDYELFEKEVADFFRTKDKEMLAQGHTRTNFEWVTYPDGEEVYLLTAKGPLYDDKGVVIGLVGNSADLTKQKLLEERLQTSKAQFERFMENIPGLVSIKDVDDKVIYTNKLASKFFGRESLVGLDAYDLMPVSVSDKLRDLNKSAKEKGYAEDVVFYADAAQRSYVFKVMTFAIKEAPTVQTGSIYLDITDQYNDQHEIVKFKQIMEKSPVSIVITDVEGKIEYVNPWFTHVTGYAMEEAIGQNPRILKSDLHVDSDYVRLWDEISHRHVWTGTFKNIKKSGEEYWETAILAPVVNDEGEIVNYVGIKQEITEEVHLREELKDKEEIMIAQSRHAAMGEMISMIAHQWRQPITVISMGANNILADIDLEQVSTDELREQAKGILKQTLHLSKTIDDFRDFFRPDKGQEEVRPEDVMEEAHKIIGKSLEYSNVDYRVKNENTHMVKTYSRELLQVYINIVKNAKEALVENRDKERRVEVRFTSKAGFVRTVICDNGGGIDLSIIDKIFDPYFSTKDAKTGTGLGLYMSKTIIEKHLHGTLSVRNSEEGACFTILIPIDQAVDNAEKE